LGYITFDLAGAELLFQLLTFFTPASHPLAPESPSPGRRHTACRCR
jgi:hypothetical protein